MACSGWSKILIKYFYKKYSSSLFLKSFLKKFEIFTVWEFQNNDYNIGIPYKDGDGDGKIDSAGYYYEETRCRNKEKNIVNIKKYDNQDWSKNGKQW